jgi:UDP-3-O-[3-hydroxymyristoyl] glucosamine N-acyltransferase
MISLKTIAKAVNGHLTGNADTLISGIAGIQEAKDGDITFLTNTGFRRYLKDCRASAVILGEDVSVDDLKDKDIITVKSPMLAYVKVAEIFSPHKEKQRGINPMASVSEDAHVAGEVFIYPYVYVDRGATIGRGVTLYPFVSVGENVVIGEDTVIYPHVTIYDGVKIGKRVIIHGGTVLGSDGFGYVWDGNRHVKIPQLGIVEIEDDVEVGANVTVDRAALGRTIIKKGTKIDNLVQIAHNVSIGDNSIIVAQVGIAGSTTIGKNVILAGQVAVNDHVTIGDNVKAGGRTGITKDVPENSLISGHPHMPHREWARLQAYLKKLPMLFHRMKKVEEKLHMEGEND